jgi:3-phenylpropionate/trans-cinnamate dioxygenase ferredoxin reductase subunit
MDRIVILGAGQAGGWAAKTLRDQKFKGGIVLVGDEEYPPYERPPLSKGVLLGTHMPESTFLWATDKFKELDIDLVLGCRAVSINRENKSVVLSSGATLTYDRLMITTGSRPRKLSTSGVDLQGIHYLRRIGDALAISRSLVPGSHLLIVGGGWIGLEIAAVARQKNVEVTLVEASKQLCSRVLPPDLARYLEMQHQRRGVHILCNTNVTEFHGDKHVERVELSNGTGIAANAVVIGIGVIPNSEIAREAGLDTENGILVDSSGRTSDESTYAAGDVANQPRGLGGRVRLESWFNAQNQAIATAKAMLGIESIYNDIPYFWSDQYDIKLQILGSFASFDDIVHRGEKSTELTSFFLKDGKIVAVVGINRPQDIAIARRLMQKTIAIKPKHLRSARNLNEILRRPSALGSILSGINRAFENLMR